MSTSPAHIYILDDEPDVCAALARFVRSAGMQPRAFDSVDHFMRADLTDENACVISDILMPGTLALDLPLLLARAGRHLPVIFVTGCDSEETRNRAHSGGASAYFRKPVDGRALLDAIEWALGQHRPLTEDFREADADTQQVNENAEYHDGDVRMNEEVGGKSGLRSRRQGDSQTPSKS